MTEYIPPEMKERYEKAKRLIENSDDIKIYSHTDCDGISSGAILSCILDRLGKKFEIEIVIIFRVIEIFLVNRKLKRFGKCSYRT